MKERIKNINKAHIVLGVLILVQAVYLCVMFGIYKQGFHSDEIWNYGFSNSVERTHLFQSDVGNVPENVDSWQSSDMFKSYLTVAKNEIFNYAAAYRNAANDYNPPLGYFMLHFVCSLFPGTWSKWYCFAINIVFFAITQIYLYRLVKSLADSEFLGLVGCGFYGFTMGALDIAFFLRIYAPAVAFAVMLCYYCHELFVAKDDAKRHKRLLMECFISSFLGCFTLNLFLIFDFVLVAMYCLYYLVARRLKLFFKYGFTMLGSALLAQILFPVNINKALFFLGLTTMNVNGEEAAYSDTFAYSMYPQFFQFKLYWEFMTTDLFGFHTSRWATMTSTYFLYGVLVLVFFLVPFCFIFRNETWLHKAFAFLKVQLKNFWNLVRSSWYSIVVFFVVMFAVVYVDSVRTTIYGMGRASVRYVFLLYPILAAVATVIAGSLVRCPFSKFSKKRFGRVVRSVVCIAIACIFAAFSNLIAPMTFAFEHEGTGVTLADLEEDSNSILLMSYYWLVTCLANEMYDTGNYYLTAYETALEQNCDTGDVDLTKPLYLIVDTSGLDLELTESFMGASVKWQEGILTDRYEKQDYLDYFSSQAYATKCELVGTDEVFGRAVEIYRLN